MVPKITLLVLILSGLGLADPIIFSIQGVGTGTVDTTAFTDAAFTFTVTSDTTLITAFADEDGETGFQTPDVSGAGISIGGFGSGTFTDAEDIFVSNNTTYAGITDEGADDLLDGFNTSFATYDLQSSIGPLSMTSLEALNQFLDIPTSLGSVSFTLATGVLFTAATVVTPEPGTLVLGVAEALLLAGIKLLARVR
jgi:hypothetical protein